MSQLKSDMINYSTLLNELKNCFSILNVKDVETVFNNPMLKDYFDRVPKGKKSKSQDATVEKMIAVAMAKYVSKKTGVPEEQVIAVSRKTVDLLRNIKLKNLLQKGLITEKQYKKLVKYTKTSGLIAGIKAGMSWLKKKGLTSTLSKAADFVLTKIPHPLAKAVNVVKKIWQIVPEPIKDRIKDKAKDIAVKVVSKIPEVAKKVYDKGKVFVKNTLQRVDNAIRSSFSTAKVVVSSAWNAAKSMVKGFASIFS